MEEKEKSEKVALKFNIQKTNIMASGSITSWQIDEETMTNFILVLQNQSRWWLQPRSKHPWKKSSGQFRQHIKKQRHYFFSSSHVWMWELDYKESWVPKNWCFWTVVLRKTLESPLNCKEIKPVNSKGNQSWIHWKDWYWIWSSNTLATWCKELTQLKRPWWWERLKAREEGDKRG